MRRRWRVAVLDDDEDVLRLLAILLERVGFEPATYAGSFDRLSFLVRHEPDLVLLDVNMPGVGGDEFFELLRDDPRLAHVPVLFLSSNDESDLRRLVRRTGAAGYLVKGHFGRGFAARLERVLAALVPPAALDAPA